MAAAVLREVTRKVAGAASNLRAAEQEEGEEEAVRRMRCAGGGLASPA